MSQAVRARLLDRQRRLLAVSITYRGGNAPVRNPWNYSLGVTKAITALGERIKAIPYEYIA